MLKFGVSSGFSACSDLARGNTTVPCTAYQGIHVFEETADECQHLCYVSLGAVDLWTSKRFLKVFFSR